MRRRPLSVVALACAAVAFAGGCAGGGQDPWSQPRPRPAAVGELKAGFTAPTGTPAPESTLTPAPRSWSGVHPPGGYRVVLLSAGDDPTVRTLVKAVEDWAEDQDVDLRTERAADAGDLVPAADRAMKPGPDLVIAVGNDLVDPLALVTAHHLDRQFLVVGAELAEPTENVTAVDWTGASFRGEGLGMSSTYDAATFTPARAAAAVRAGTAAVLSGLTGIVVWMDDYE